LKKNVILSVAFFGVAASIYFLVKQNKSGGIAEAVTATSEEVKNYGLNIYNNLFNEELSVTNQTASQFDDKSIPLGIRNNNPGNIELGDNWQGMRVPQTHPRFIQFTDAKYGIRAMTRIIDNYKKRGVLTVDQIINTWAPSFENNVSAYLNHVLSLTGFASFYVPNKARGDYLPLIKAIIQHENGQQPYSDLTIVEGIGMA